MSKRASTRVVVLLLCSGMTATAQGVPRASSTHQLTSSDMRGAVVPAGSTSTLLTFSVEADTTGKNLFDVATSDPAVAVSLILPSGTEVTSLVRHTPISSGSRFSRRWGSSAVRGLEY